MSDKGWLLAELGERAAGTPAADDADAQNKAKQLAEAVDSIWDEINAHNGMEYAEVFSKKLPPAERAVFATALREKLGKRPDFEQELNSNTAGHCLRRALDGGAAD